MSRHRNVRNFINIDSEYYDDEVFGRSLEEDSPLSPSLHQFIYSRDGSTGRHSVDAVVEEDADDVNDAIHQMSEILDDQFDMETARETLSMYDNNVSRALNHVMEHAPVYHSGDRAPTAANTVMKPDQLARAINHRLLVVEGDKTPTNSRTPTNSLTPKKANTPKTGSPPLPKRLLENKEAPAQTVTPKKKYRPKDIDVLGILNTKSNNKPLVNVVVVGHVDAGKSTLMGHLLCMLGVVSKKEIHKNKQESQKLGKASFAYAWVLDETGEERERGVTIDVAQTRFETKKRVVNLLDAPGHRDFVPNMISGASQGDIAVLVVDSTQGGFEAGFEQGGQTREHVVLVRALGVQALIVAINKMENVSWSQGRYNAIKADLNKFFRSVGFKPSEVYFVPLSGLQGENLVNRSTVPQLSSWYDGESLVDIIDSLEPPKRDYEMPFRLVVTDVFKHPQLGLSVAGKVDSGFVIVGTPVVVMPGGDGTIVKSITVNDKSVDYAVAGEQCICILGGIDQSKLHKGNVICESHSKVRTTCKFRARILVFNIEVPITKGFPIDLHYQTVSEPAVISRLISVTTHSKSAGEVIKPKPRCLTKNQVAHVEIKVQRSICLELYKTSKSLGRITCRYGGHTIASGMVV